MVRGYGMYIKFWKRFLDFILSLMALLVLSPLLLLLTLIGAIAMRGNPFFVQERVGWHEKKFKLIKFRTMSNKKDKDGKLLPDAVRLNRYGRILRKTSLDELPELVNILKGDMSIVGPRPLLVEYLPYYTEEERHRHDIRPGLTGLAQVEGRNFITWEKIFYFDIYYLKQISFALDIKVLLKTIEKVFFQADIEDAIQVAENKNKSVAHKPLNIERENAYVKGDRF